MNQNDVVISPLYGSMPAGSAMPSCGTFCRRAAPMQRRWVEDASAARSELASKVCATEEILAFSPQRRTKRGIWSMPWIGTNQAGAPLAHLRFESCRRHSARSRRAGLSETFLFFERSKEQLAERQPQRNANPSFPE